MPRKSLSVISFGSLPFSARSISPPLAKFGIDVGQTQSPIDLRLVRRDRAPAVVQAVRLQPHSFLGGQAAQFVEVRGRSGGEEERGAEVFAVGEVDLESLRI